MFGFGNEAEMPEEAPEGVVTPEDVIMEGDKDGNDEPKLELVEDQLDSNEDAGTDPYNSADKVEDIPEELRSEHSANQALKDTIEEDKAA